MDSPGLDEALDGGFLGLFDSQDDDSVGKNQHHTIMDLDVAAGSLSGVPSLGLDDGRFGLDLEPALGRFPGHADLMLSSALRSQAVADHPPVPVTVSDKDIRPSVTHSAAPSASTATPAASSVTVSAAAPAAPTFTIRPMPARKSTAQKSSATAAVSAVKAEPAADQHKQQQQAREQQAAREQAQQQLEQMEAEADAAAFDSDSDGPSSAHGGGKRRRRIRNAKQQELNRLAQQRYRERRKQKYSTLQDTVEELSSRVGKLSTLEAANNELQQRNTHLEVVVKDQTAQLQAQKETITRQAQQLQTQALQLSSQAKQLHAQVTVIQQQDRTLQELRSQLANNGVAAASPAAAVPSTAAGAAAAASAEGAGASNAADADQLNDQIALAVRAVLTGVSSMASVSFPPAKDAAQMQQIAELPDALLQQIRTCCREVALHLKKADVKEQPHAITVPCC